MGFFLGATKGCKSDIERGLFGTLGYLFPKRGCRKKKGILIIMLTEHVQEKSAAVIFPIQG